MPAGTLRASVKIQTRTGSAGAGSSIDELFADVATVWAAIETLRGRQLRDGVEAGELASHRFRIRYRSDVTVDHWIEYTRPGLAASKFRILGVENIGERGIWLDCLAEERG